MYSVVRKSDDSLIGFVDNISVLKYMNNVALVNMRGLVLIIEC